MEQPTQLHRRIVKEFWESFGRNKKKAMFCSERKRVLALAELKRLSRLVIPYKHGMPLKERRDSFNNVKFKRHSLTSHALCFLCRGQGDVRHHIIALKNGGINSKRNLLTLCKPCHAEIHPWLRVIHN